MAGQFDDADWLDLRLLEDRKPMPNEAQEYSFLERVGIKIDSDIPEQQAREQAYKEVFGK